MTLSQDILDLASKGPAGLEEPDRLALLQAAEKLTLALETPLDKFLRHFFVRLPILIHYPHAIYILDMLP
jgi:hypothetical protein